MTRYYLEQALHAATTGRKGPVFLEFPLDVQAAQFDERQPGYTPPRADDYLFNIRPVVDMLNKAERPVLLIGAGSRGTEIDSLPLMPIVTTWGGKDVIPNKWGVGCCGIFGDRASNLAIQNADLIISIGARWAVGTVGHNVKDFGRNAKKIVVDVDVNEARKHSPNIALATDAKTFVRALAEEMKSYVPRQAWMIQCLAWRADLEEKRENDAASGLIDAYDVMRDLASNADDDAIIVTDVGFSYIPAFQSIKLKPGQRLIHSHGVSPMGWAIPASIGASVSSPGRQVICLTGDGGAMMNLQELATIAGRKLPIAMFVFDNGGYETMRIAQNNHFGRTVMTSDKEGVHIPQLQPIARAFGIRCEILVGKSLSRFGALLKAAKRAPVMSVLMMQLNSVISPRVQSRSENGKFIPTPIEDMWPYMPRSEFAKAMAVSQQGGDDVDDRRSVRRG